MFDILVPKNHFLNDSGHYPDMEDYILGLTIPLGWGDIHNVVPFCVDVADLRFKLVDQHIQDITEIRSKGQVLSAGSYTEDLTVAEFTLKGTPYVVAGFTYYFAISASYAINGTDYLVFSKCARIVGCGSYQIDGADVWSLEATRQLRFDVYGKETLDGEESLIFHGLLFPPVSTLALRDAAARTRIGDKFVAPAPGYYVTRIRVVIDSEVGSPTGTLTATLYSAINPEAQQGIQGNAVPIVAGTTSYYLDFPQDGEDSDLVADIESPYPMLTTGAEVLEDLFVSILDKNPVPALLEPTALANFAAKKTQALKVFIDREMPVGEFIGKLEASLLWKFLPLQDGTYATVVFESGIPAGTPHFRDIDFVEGTEFRIEHDLSVVRNVSRVKYDEDPATQEFKVAESRSDYARLFYSNEETAEVETWLKNEADAEVLAEDYAYLFQEPQVRVVFEVHGAGLTLLPGRDKVLVTRSRAAWAGGALNTELFRVMKVVKKPATNTAEITAVLDAQTYMPAPALWGTLLIVDTGNNRIKRHDMTGAFIAECGSAGAGDDNFSVPYCVCTDGTYFYVTDNANNRIVKRLLSDFSFVAKIGSFGAGNDQFNAPRGICTDGTYIYICDQANNRIHKRRCSDLSLVSFATADGINTPRVICTDGSYLYIAQNSGAPIPRLFKYTFNFDLIATKFEDADDTVSNCLGICVSGGFLYLTNVNQPDTHYCFRKYTTGLVFVAKYILGGSYDPEEICQPYGIVADASHLYVMNTNPGSFINPQECQILGLDGSFQFRFGTYGATGDDKFNWPLGICIAP